MDRSDISGGFRQRWVKSFTTPSHYHWLVVLWSVVSVEMIWRTYFAHTSYHVGRVISSPPDQIMNLNKVVMYVCIQGLDAFFVTHVLVFHFHVFYLVCTLLFLCIWLFITGQSNRMNQLEHHDITNQSAAKRCGYLMWYTPQIWGLWYQKQVSRQG